MNAVRASDGEGPALRGQAGHASASSPAQSDPQTADPQNSDPQNDVSLSLSFFFGSHDSLLIRTLSGIVLGPAALLACFVGGAAFAGLTAFLAIAMVFEWTRMVAGREPGAPFYALALFSTGAMIAAAAGFYGLAYNAAFFGGGASFLAAIMTRRVNDRASLVQALWMGAGAIYVVAPSIALVWLREDVDGGRGLVFLLFAIVWSADSAAFLGGRLMGGPRLSPTLSPAKTWSGAACGVAAGGLIGLFFAETLLSGGGAGSDLGPSVSGGAAYALTGAALGLASILGDIIESAFKRIFGVKDISGFIPGHGGVLDRLDGMIFATASIAIVLYGQILFARF